MGDSPLLVAVAEGHEVIARCLLRSGADKNYQNVSGQTPLHIAASLGNFECVNALLEVAPPHLSAAANPNPNCNRERIMEQIDLTRMIHPDSSCCTYRQAHADTEIKNVYGNTPLIVAAACDQEAALRRLLEAGADTEATNQDGMTGLLMAAAFEKAQGMRALLQFHCHLDAQDSNGDTALNLAVRGAL